ncbi:hypothetical protein AX15_006203 [Amanita polypyramis BW_CC]|nr:hypothetical protein AX15_006203 [Amanita polypyramis BW_CC]
MKQIAYLTMVFLPASFVAGVFGMNVKEIAPTTNATLAQYFETVCALTAATVWIIVAFQSRYLFDRRMPFWQRLGWPIYSIYYMFDRVRNPKRFEEKHKDSSAPIFGPLFGGYHHAQA